LGETISIIIPVYNGEGIVGETLESYYSYFSKNHSEFEIIAVVNNCTDSSPKIVSAFSRGKSKIKVLKFDYYIGKGGAVMEGFSVAKGKIICFADQDNSVSAEELMKLIKGIKQFDAVIASRAVKESVLLKAQPWYRQILGKTFMFIVNILFNLRVNDSVCGGKVFSRKVVDIFLRNDIVKGFEFDVQLIWICRKNNLLVLEKGIKWANYENSTMGWRDPFRMLMSLLKMRLK